jgi:hypothetical protein
MYFGVKVDGRRHLWRQSFPYGQPERITAQPIEERGIAVMPIDGSLITSLSMSQNTLWMHDSKGEHPLSTEGYATAVDDGAGRPVFSADGKRLYYLLRDSLESSDELRRRDMDSGAIETILPGVDVRNFDISPDEKEVIYSVHPAGQPSQLWLAALDRRSPPRRIASGGEAVPHFGPNGRIVFRMDEGKAHYLAIMDRDGSDRTKLLPYPIVDFGTMSPDRRIAVVFTGARPADPSHAAAMLAVPTRGGTPRPICLNCPITWSPDGKYFLLGSPSWHDDPNGRTVAIPVPAGETLPHLPEGGFGAEIDPATIPGARVITHNYVVPSRDPFTYAYVKTSTHSNLFRIQFH